MKDENETKVNDAINRAISNGDDFVNAEEYIEGSTPIFDEATEFAQPASKKSTRHIVAGVLVAFVFLIGLCVFALFSEDSSIKSFLRI